MDNLSTAMKQAAAGDLSDVTLVVAKEYRQLPPIETDPLDGFRQAIADAGLLLPDHIDADGQIHRFSTNGKTGDKAGYYCLHLDGVAAGHFGCWREGIQQNWSARNGSKLDASELKRLKASIREAERQRAAYASKRAEKAKSLWSSANPAKQDHPYLKKKGVSVSAEIRQADIERAVFFDDDSKTGIIKDCLLVPVETSDGLQSLQAITPDGSKMFLSGGAIGSGYCALSGSAEAVYLVEGLATGLSVREATGCTVVVAFNSGNLSKVAERIRGESPAARIVIAGDNDHGTEGTPGKAAAEKAAATIGAKVLLPPAGDHGTDWNDYHSAHGIASVRAELQGLQQDATDKIRERLNAAKAKHLLAQTPPPQKFVIEGMLPEPVAAAVVAPGSTGKSFFLMQLAACVTTGVPFMGQVIPNPGAVLMMGAEDDTDEMSRRLHSIAKEYEWDGDRLDLDLLGERFYPFSLVGKDNRLIKDGEREESRIQELIETAQAIPDLRLIILDPVSRFRAGEENSNDDNTRFAEVLEFIRQQTGVTVLVAHHSRKGSNGDSVDDMRGASAFSDALRFVATLARPNEDRAKALGLDYDDAKKMVRYRVVKSNYRTDIDEFWMRSGMGGVLKPTPAPAALPSKSEAKGEERYSATLPKLIDLIRQKDEAGEPLTRNALRKYAGQSGVFGIGEQGLRGIVERAIEEGKVFKREDGTLHLY